MGFGIRQCVICGREYEAVRRNQVTCGGKPCQSRQHQQYTKGWIAAWQERDMEGYKRYKRNKARGYRERDRQARMNKTSKPLPDNNGVSTYAEKQIKKTLASVPRINTQL